MEGAFSAFFIVYDLTKLESWKARKLESSKAGKLESSKARSSKLEARSPKPEALNHSSLFAFSPFTFFIQEYYL